MWTESYHKNETLLIIIRFSEEGSGTYDQEAALFHVKQAAHCGVVEGLIAAAQLNLGLPHIILPDVEVSS